MKLKIELQLGTTTREKRLAARLGIPVLLLAMGGVAVAASLPVSWQSGDTLTAEDLNANFAALAQRLELLEARLGPESGFFAYLSSEEPAFTGSPQAVLFDVEEYDFSDEYDPSTGVFSPKTSGTYLLSCHLEFIASASQAYTMDITINDAAELDGAVSHAALEGWGVSVSVSTPAQLSAGDFVRCLGNTSVNGQASSNLIPRRNHFTATRLY